MKTQVIYIPSLKCDVVYTIGQNATDNDAIIDAAGSLATDFTAGGAGGSGIVVIRYPSYLAQAASTTGSPETYVTGFWRVYKFVASGTITF